MNLKCWLIGLCGLVLCLIGIMTTAMVLYTGREFEILPIVAIWCVGGVALLQMGYYEYGVGKK